MRAFFVVLWLFLAAALLIPVLRRLRRARAPAGPVRLEPGDELVKDPVCKVYVVRSRAVTRGEGIGQRYFCSADCADAYARGPEE